MRKRLTVTGVIVGTRFGEKGLSSMVSSMNVFPLELELDIEPSLHPEGCSCWRWFAGQGSAPQWVGLRPPQWRSPAASCYPPDGEVYAGEYFPRPPWVRIQLVPQVKSEGNVGVKWWA